METNQYKAIANAKCPRCREGDMFKNNLLERPLKPLEMHEHCPSCQLKFEIEPGFFWASLYISYAMNVAIMVATVLALSIFTNAKSPLDFIIPVVVIMFLTFPVVMRYARVLLLYFFASIKYNPKVLKH